MHHGSAGAGDDRYNRCTIKDLWRCERSPRNSGFPEELVEAVGPWKAWFSPTEGLRCVEGLLAALEDPRVRARIASVDGVIDDLVALEDVLAVAKKRKSRFRLEVA